MKKSLTTALAVGVGILSLTAGGVGYAAADTNVNLSVDGQQRQVHHLSGTVGDVLRAQNIQLSEHDQVTPSISTALRDDQNVDVKYGRLVTITVNGTVHTLWTTSPSLTAVLAQLGLNPDKTQLSVPKDTAVPRGGITLSADTAKQVTVQVDGKTIVIDTTAATLKDMLAQHGITMGPQDAASTDLDAAPADNSTISISRVNAQQQTTTEDIPFQVKKTNDDTLAKGTTKVKTQGVNGKKTVTWSVTAVDGKEQSRERVSESVTTQPVDEVDLVGTKDTSTASTSSTSSTSSSSSSSSSASASASQSESSSDGLNTANSEMWDRIAQCESSGNWSISTGNGYSGGLQFDSGTWLSAGGGKYAPTASQATREQQITVANTIYASRGLSPWGCAGAA